MFTLQRKIGVSINIFFRGIEFHNIFDPDNKEVLIRKDEDLRYKSPVKGIDGAEVGGNTPQSADKTSENKDKREGEKKDTKSEILSPEEMQDAIAVSKANLKDYAEQDPSNLALQEHGPEKIKQAGLEVEKEGWPC